mmetsp:Transcript_11527/g.22022  ORF Transcript_11527/g.22022 Transcript_11527/m.22022 type:complete len:298 (+) Transcript_11527:134-1027(+)
MHVGVVPVGAAAGLLIVSLVVRLVRPRAQSPKEDLSNDDSSKVPEPECAPKSAQKGISGPVKSAKKKPSRRLPGKSLDDPLTEHFTSSIDLGDVKAQESAPKAEKPTEAQGSAWNLNSWHFEEQDFTAWGEARLKQLLSQVPLAKISVEMDDLPASLSCVLDLKKLTGSAWTHIRKGKKIIGYDYEITMSWKGDIDQCGMLVTTASGEAKYELTVDDDEPTFEVSCSESYPWFSVLKADILRCLNGRCQLFVKELQAKGGGKGWTPEVEGNVQVGQYSHYEGVDGTAQSVSAAKEAS